jgi:hypothetical protein
MAHNLEPKSKDFLDWVSERANRNRGHIETLASRLLEGVGIDPAQCTGLFAYQNGWDWAGEPYEIFKYSIFDKSNLKVKGTMTGGTTGTIAFRLLPPFVPNRDISIVGNVEQTGEMIPAWLGIDSTNGDVTVNF